MSKAELKIDWATHEAAKYACESWHYSKCVPVGKIVKVGVWENKKFIGVILFSRGANKNMLNPYGLSQAQGCELTRVALSKHETPVSKIIAIAIKFLKKNSPGLRLIVSYADTAQGHHGGIYQAGNWVYSHSSMNSNDFYVNGKKMHKKSIYDKYGVNSTERLKEMGLKIELKQSSPKHCYLMALDKEMCEHIKSFSKPYPKRTKEQAIKNHFILGGATPTCTLQSLKGSNYA